MILLCVILAWASISTVVKAETIKIPFEYIQQNTSCSSVQDKTLEINYQGKLYQINFENLYSTPVINAALVCERFLRSLRDIRKPKPVIPLVEQFMKSDLKFYIDQSGFLEKACLQLGYCKRNILDTFRPKKQLRNCHGKVTLAGLLDKSKPKILGVESKIIHDVTVKLHPFEPFSELLRQYINDPNLQEIHTSTMTLGNQLLSSLSEDLVKTNKKLVLSYDAGVSLFNNQEIRIAKILETAPYAQFIPLTSGYNFDYFYHIKFIASPQTNKSMLASMNLATPDRTPYIDLNFFFNSPEIRDEFLSISKNNNQRFCERKEDYECLANFYSEETSSHIPELITRNCPVNNPESKIYRSGYFVNSEDHDLKQYVLNFINQAKEEIIVTSYKLTDRSIANALLKKQKEGLKVYVMLAFKSPVISKEFANQFYSGDVVKDQYPFPHMKVIIVDRKELLFGTANFTVNALNNTTELLGKTDNQLAIKTAYDYASVFTQSKNIDLSRELSPETKEHNYVAVTNANEVEPENLPYTETLSQSWMSNYRMVNEDGEKILTKCNLKHLIFITKATYKSCLKELGEI